MKNNDMPTIVNCINKYKQTFLIEYYCVVD